MSKTSSKIEHWPSYSALALLCGLQPAFCNAQQPGGSVPIRIPSVSSTAQKSGVTAGYVNQLTQNVLPTLVQGPQLEKLKAIFVDGARLSRAYNFVVSDVDIDKLVKGSNTWADETFNWLNQNVSPYAAERFAFRPPTITLGYTLNGDHAPGYAQKYGEGRKMMGEFLVNLDQLMRDPSIYPSS